MAANEIQASNDESRRLVAERLAATEIHLAPQRQAGRCLGSHQAAALAHPRAWCCVRLAARNVPHRHYYSKCAHASPGD